MYFRDTIGQSTAKDELRRSFLSGVVPHARLFVGEDGSGALALAYAYARYINCSTPDAEDACGVCPSCQKFDQYAGQDLHFLFPIVNVGSRNLCDDELPRWREFLASSPYTTYADWLRLEDAESKRLGIFTREGEVLQDKLSYQVTDARYRILLIWLPERMHEALANKLLKLTEEPPEHTIILMVTMNEREVLGTLRSRMQTLHLRPLSEAEIAMGLAKVANHPAGADSSLSAHLASGNYRKALDHYLGRADSTDKLTTLYGRILRATVNARPLEIKALADELAGLSREEQMELLTYVGQMFRESYLYGLQMPEINYVNPTEQRIVDYLRTCINGRNIRSLHDELDLAMRHIAQNVNSRMVFYDMILRLTAALAPHYRQIGLR